MSEKSKGYSWDGTLVTAAYDRILTGKESDRDFPPVPKVPEGVLKRTMEACERTMDVMLALYPDPDDIHGIEVPFGVEEEFVPPKVPEPLPDGNPLILAWLGRFFVPLLVPVRRAFFKGAGTTTRKRCGEGKTTGS